MFGAQNCTPLCDIQPLLALHDKLCRDRPPLPIKSYFWPSGNPPDAFSFICESINSSNICQWPILIDYWKILTPLITTSYSIFSGLYGIRASRPATIRLKNQCSGWTWACRYIVLYVAAIILRSVPKEILSFYVSKALGITKCPINF